MVIGISRLGLPTGVWPDYGDYQKRELFPSKMLKMDSKTHILVVRMDDDHQTIPPIFRRKFPFRNVVCVSVVLSLFCTMFSSIILRTILSISPKKQRGMLNPSFLFQNCRRKTPKWRVTTRIRNKPMLKLMKNNVVCFARKFFYPRFKETRARPELFS